MPAFAALTRSVQRLVVWLLVPLIAFIGALAWLIGSEAGTRILADAAGSVLSDQVHWRSIEGRLLGPLRIGDLAVTAPGIELSVRDLELNWAPAALLSGAVRITALRAHDIDVSLSGAESGEEEGEVFDPESLLLPLDLRLDAMALRNVTIAQGEAPLQRVKSVDARAHLMGKVLTLERVALRAPDGGVEIRLDTTLDRDMPLALELSWDWAIPDDAVPGGFPSSAPRPRLAGHVHIAGSVEWADMPGFSFEHSSRFQGLEHLAVDLPMDLSLTGQLRGAGGGDQAQIELFSVSLGDQSGFLSVEGSVSGLANVVPDADLILAWRDLRWPLKSDAPIAETPEGRLRFKGSPAAYALELAAVVHGQDLPSGNWRLKAAGKPEFLDLAPLRGGILGGHVETTGRVTWAPMPSWELEVHGSGLDPGKIDATVSGDVSFDLATRGALTPDSGPQVELQVGDLYGVIAGRPLKLRADARLRGDTLDLTELVAMSEGAELRVDGSAAQDTLDLRWEVETTTLEPLLPGASGHVTANGLVGGSAAAPWLTAKVSGQGLGFEEFHLTALEVHSRLGVASDAPLNLDFILGEVRSAQGVLVEGARITATGTLSDQSLGFEARTPREEVSLQMSGAADLERTLWRGSLDTLALASADFGTWSLQMPVGAQFSEEGASLASACLKRVEDAGLLCLGGGFHRDGTAEAEISLSAVPVGAFVDDFTGDLGGKGRVRYESNGELRGNLSLALSEGNILLAAPQGVQRLGHGGGTADVRIDAQGLSSHLKFVAPESGSVAADLAIPGFDRLPLASDQHLDGHLMLAVPKLQILGTWMPGLTDIGGRLEGDLRIGGTLSTPRINGGVALRDGQARLADAGVHLQDFHVAIEAEPGAPEILKLDGRFRSGAGSATLEGSADIRAMEAALTLAGQNLSVYNTADAQAVLSPDLALAWSDDTIRLRGDLVVPEARITPQVQLRTAATAEEGPEERPPGQVLAPSPDVVIINAESERVPGSDSDSEVDVPFKIDSRVRLSLGDSVEVRALGFRSRIDGAVTFTHSPERDAVVPIAEGSLNLREGTLRAFGQDLDIETGQLIFARVPATEPEVNIRAVRWIDNDPEVTAAGVLVTGPAAQPVLELFSRPQLEVSEIQSYLLTGTSASERSNVLAIGTYLTPRLYVGYGYNVLESTNEVSSLFSITPTYGISANAGDTDSNINLTVTYER